MTDFKGHNIALTGGMRSGKDTVGKYLCKQHGFERFAFGDSIRRVCRELFPEAFKHGGKPRKLLQEFGQFCVSIDTNVWVNYLFQEIDSFGFDLKEDNIVITDLRQPHEYEALRKKGFVIVRVNCEPELRKRRIIDSGEQFSEENFNHETEQHIDTFEVDWELDNNGTEEDLFQQVEFMLSKIIKGSV